MINRRTFVKKIAATGVVCSLIPDMLLAGNFKQEWGIQLYTIRDLISRDFKGTLKMIADIGYQSVEAAGYENGLFYGLKPKEYEKIVIGYGMKPLSSHSAVATDNAVQVIEDTLNAGMKYLVLPSLPGDRRKTIDDFKHAADDFNEIGEKCRDTGLTFGYHNHAFEFEMMDGEIPYDILIENTDPELVTMQVDLYWMIYGGQKPESYFRKFPGRFKLWHVKDMMDDPSKESTEVGSGIIDFPSLFGMADQAGLEAAFVEQETFKIDPVDSIGRSLQYLNTL